MDIDEGNVNLVSQEGVSFTVPVEVAKVSELVKSMIDDDAAEDMSAISLPKVKATVLQKVIEFCKHHKEEPMTDFKKPIKSKNMADVVEKWYADYVDVEQGVLFDLICAANYMDIKPLLDLTCATAAMMIKAKTSDGIRTTFNITNEFSSEEESQFREENTWFEEA
ncbi:Skp1 family [Fragilaria crotonensis]|nr:Skp1 family [Fragilaria crotonensis]